MNMSDRIYREFPLVRTPLNKGRVYIVDGHCWQVRSAMAPWHPSEVGTSAFDTTERSQIPAASYSGPVIHSILCGDPIHAWLHLSLPFPTCTRQTEERPV